MKREHRSAGRLLMLLALLALVLGLRSEWFGREAGELFSTLTGGPPPTSDPDLLRSRTLPTTQRIDLLLALILRGNPAAHREVLEWTRSRFVPGSLAAEHRQQLEILARRTTLDQVRQAGAALLLADGHDPAGDLQLERWCRAEQSHRSTLGPIPSAAAIHRFGLKALSGVIPAWGLGCVKELTRSELPLALRTEAWRALATLGDPALLPLLEAWIEPTLGAAAPALVEAWLDLSTRQLKVRSLAVPAAIHALEQPALPVANQEAARSFLRELSGRTGPADPASWRAWWQATALDSPGKTGP